MQGKTQGKIVDAAILPELCPLALNGTLQDLTEPHTRIVLSVSKVNEFCYLEEV